MQRDTSMVNRACQILPLASLPLLITACGGGDSDNGNLNAQQEHRVAIQFTAQANGTEIDCDTLLTGLGLAGTDANLKDFRFYVHDIELLTTSGDAIGLTLDSNPWQQTDKGIALLDFQNRADGCGGDVKETHKQVSGTIVRASMDDIQGLRFKLGLPTHLNHQDQAGATSPLNISSLFWSWQTGYKFMRLDVAPIGGVIRPTDPAFSSTTYNFHLGSTNCTGSPQLNEDVNCEKSNRPQVELFDFDPRSNKSMLDYGTLVAQANLGADGGGPAGCMSGTSDPECGSIFTALGLDIETGEVVSDPVQTIFTVE
ncbi:MAG: metallo-mystery pair system four-Cys motif protein [Pseudomonadales bacterium]|nr:metallo-mystery pair system four-Cys motif protein [Pseudomonadales bacterium]